jgi:hypothetical protein
MDTITSMLLALMSPFCVPGPLVPPGRLPASPPPSPPLHAHGPRDPLIPRGARGQNANWNTPGCTSTPRNANQQTPPAEAVRAVQGSEWRRHWHNNIGPPTNNTAHTRTPIHESVRSPAPSTTFVPRGARGTIAQASTAEGSGVPSTPNRGNISIGVRDESTDALRTAAIGAFCMPHYQ